MPDRAALEVAPGGVLSGTAVTFRGWLSGTDDGDPLSGGIYRFYTSPWFDEWLEIGEDDLLSRLEGTESSIIWVKRDARIRKYTRHEEDACHFAEQVAGLEEEDPTAYPTAVRRRYPTG